jgi:hypothetical protein
MLIDWTCWSLGLVGMVAVDTTSALLEKPSKHRRPRGRHRLALVGTGHTPVGTTQLGGTMGERKRHYSDSGSSKGAAGPHHLEQTAAADQAVCRTSSTWGMREGSIVVPASDPP